MVTFKELGLSDDVLRVLDGLEFTEPTEIQEKAIPLVLAGRDVIGGSATGSGKTLAFAAPILENVKQGNGIQALILTPTRELACQVAESIDVFAKNKGLDILPVYGGVSVSVQIDNLRRTDVVVGTPGRILDHLERKTLDLSKVKFLILDEVDRMFDMGFHIDVEKIISKCPAKRQTMLFSATITGEVDYFANKYTSNAEQIAVKSFLDPSVLTQVYYDVPNNKKFSLMVHLLKNEASGLVMIFSNTKSNADFLTKNLHNVGIDAKAIHGGLSQNRRSSVLDAFHNNRVSVLVCTDVAARGLDIKGVSHVYNYDLPNSADDYIHRIGRTARAGKDGKAISLLGSRDYDNFRKIQMQDELNIELLPNPIFDNITVEMNDRGNDRRNSRGGGRSSFGGRSDSRSSGGRPSFGGRSDSRSSGGRPSFGGRSEGRSFGGRDNRSSNSRPSYGGQSSRSSEGRPSFGGRSEGRSFGGRDNRSSSSDSRPSYGSRPSSGGRSEGRSFGGRDNRSSNSRPSYGGQSSRSSEGRPSFGGRSEGRSFGGRDNRSSSSDSRPSYGGQSSGSSYGSRPSSRERSDSRGTSERRTSRSSDKSRDGRTSSRPNFARKRS